MEQFQFLFVFRGKTITFDLNYSDVRHFLCLLPEFIIESMHYKTELYFIAVAFLFVFSTSYAQDPGQGNNAGYKEIFQLADEKYGINQQLSNGIYFEDTYRGAKGHPYLLADQFTAGDVTYFGKEYFNVPIKYDLYGQQLLIFHQADARTFTNILASQFVEDFKLYGLQFRKMVLLEEEPAYYQVVAETEELQCYYSWFRVRHESIADNNTKLYSFTEDQQRRYLVLDDEVFRYFNNWTFTRIFDNPLKRNIRSFLREHDLKIQKATDEQVREVILYAAQLIQPSDQ